VPTGTGERGAAGGERASDPSPRLTARETEILALVAEGLSNPEIAARLFIGESTVKTHLLHVFEKLAVSDRTRAVIRAMQLDLI
jgi:ATP/maltotriose-dependent transcriptional regulator MalT